MSSYMPSIRFSLLLFAMTPILINISGCSNNLQQKKTITNMHQLPYPTIDRELGEKLQPDEEIIANQITEQIVQSIRSQYSSGNALRDAHPKAHGCVRAEFHVSKSIPQNLAQGIFVPDKTYSAWIRFSNASGDATRADGTKDARGMAIKLLGVQGKKIL